MTHNHVRQSTKPQLRGFLLSVIYTITIETWQYLHKFSRALKMTETKNKKPKTTRGIMLREHKHTQSIQISFSYNGVRCRESLNLQHTSANIKYAERLKSEIQNAIERGTFDYSTYFPDSPKARLFGHVVTNKTIGELLTDYLTLYKQATENGKISPSTYKSYQKIITGHLIPVFGSIPVVEIEPIQIKEWVLTQNKTAKTVRNILTPLRAVLDDALNDGLIQNNPLDKIALNKLLTKTTTKSTYEIDPFNTEEIKAILGNWDGQGKNLIQFAFWSGLRTSELIALEWQDIDFVNNKIMVSRAVVEKTEKGTKTAAGTREVMLWPLALAALIAQKEHTFIEGKRVFYNPRTKSPWETDAQIRKTLWTHVLKKAGVRYRNPYQTRHTFASTLLSRGENIWWLSQQMGHVDAEMITRNYGKWIPDSSKKNGYKPSGNYSDFEQNDTQTTLKKEA